jgi:hypothetical protein
VWSWGGHCIVCFVGAPVFFINIPYCFLLVPCNNQLVLHSPQGLKTQQQLFLVSPPSSRRSSTTVRLCVFFVKNKENTYLAETSLILVGLTNRGGVFDPQEDTETQVTKKNSL